MSHSPDLNRKHQKDWYDNNKELKRTQVHERRKELREWYINLKMLKSCTICHVSGMDNPKAITFHHLNPETKDLEVTEMVKNGYSKQRILAEIDKCICICENCHRKYHICDCERSELRTWYANFKKELSCEECGVKDWRCLELHHIDSSMKIQSVAFMVNSERSYSFEQICDEIAKTKCLCANCHRKH